MVSHDRYFLDATATGIIDLENHQAYSYRGNYSQFLKVKSQKIEAQERAYIKQQEHIQETEEYIRRYKAGIKAKQARGRQSQLDRLERIEKPFHIDSLRFNFEKPEDCADKVLDISNLTFSYEQHTIFNNLYMQIRKGETVGIIGSNGVGKSTLLKLIIGEETFRDGHIRVGNRVKLGYYSQELNRLCPHYIVLEQVENTFNYGEAAARNILGMFLFQGDEVFKSVSMLSGGEKARLTLLMLFLDRPNFLILDEPTNHLDIMTREVMEKALLAFGGTILFVSHDRYFLDKVATRILELENGALTEYLGNYSYYKEKKKNMEEYERDKAAELSGKNIKNHIHKVGVVTTKEHAKSKSLRISTFTANMQEKLEKIEMEIQRLETTLKMYTIEMNQTPEQYETIMEFYTDTKQKLDNLYKKWEQLASSAEQ